MKETVLFMLTDQFADWEYAFLAAALQGGIQGETAPYRVKTLSLTKAPVRSIGGFRVLPDYGLEDCPTQYAGLVAIGGKPWRSAKTEPAAPLLTQAYRNGKVLGAICDATVFLGKSGLLNDRLHTSNTLDDLATTAKEKYSGQTLYRSQQAVRDGNLVTANGSAYLEFCREMLTALKAYPAATIESHYRFFKEGFIAFTRHTAGKPTT